MLTIYSIIIFRYKFVFKDIDDDIEEVILENSAKKTLNIVEKKTLDNKLIFEYITNSFIYNLKKDIRSNTFKTVKNKTIEKISIEQNNK